MKNELVPDWVFKNVSEITPQWLSGNGLTCVLVDLDNTLAPYGRNTPEQFAGVWLDSLRASGASVAVVSNNKEPRVHLFCRDLGLAYLAKAGKPRPGGLIAVAHSLGARPEETVMVGDQIFTDIRAGNRAGMTTVLVEPVKLNAFFVLRRLLETPLINCSVKRRLPDKNKPYSRGYK